MPVGEAERLVSASSLSETEMDAMLMSTLSPSDRMASVSSERGVSITLLTRSGTLEDAMAVCPKKKRVSAALKVIRLVAAESLPSRMCSREIALTDLVELALEEARLRLRSLLGSGTDMSDVEEVSVGLGTAANGGGLGSGTIQGALPKVTGPLVAEGTRVVALAVGRGGGGLLLAELGAPLAGRACSPVGRGQPTG